MKTREDITGKRYGRLVVVGEEDTHKNYSYYWSCICDCGNTVKVLKYPLEKGKTRSCGCLQRDHARKRLTKHGMTGTPLFQTWVGMIARCSNKNSRAWPYYGGRGIAVCERWHEFTNFYIDMKDTFKHGLSIDRIDNDGNYAPENCRWATDKQQCNNRRSNVYVDTENGKMSIKEASEKYGISVSTLKYRKRAGFSIDRMFNKPKYKVNNGNCDEQ